MPVNYETAVISGLVTLGILVAVYALITRRVYAPFFFVWADGGYFQGTTTLVPVGHGWAPNSSIEIFMYGEPKRTADGELYVAPPRLIVTVKANKKGIFTNYLFSDATTTPYTFPRLCGSPPGGLQDPFFLARDNKRKLFRFSHRAPHVGWWFTDQPCP